MGTMFGGGGSSSPTFTTATTYTDPQNSDENVATARDREKQKLAALKGMQSTILTGSSGDTSTAKTAKKTLLGQ